MEYTYKKRFEVGDQVNSCDSVLGTVTKRTAKMVTIGFYDIIDGSIEFERRYRIITDYRGLECCGNNGDNIHPARPLTVKEREAYDTINSINKAHGTTRNVVNMFDPHRYDTTRKELEELLSIARVTIDQVKDAFITLDKLDCPIYSPLVRTIKQQHFTSNTAAA